ncbi:ABC-F family ATP-binding cassette domain-containing protein [Patescibacteria group bacterium]|nr:ABC-F family ATP-binding cassette domain-containing protein [Patescibacteria group bacterium]
MIQKPDILLLDEPTNNLDKNGIGELITFLMMYDKTVVVISHDADFLNIFTEGVLYLNIMTHKVEQYRGDYSDALVQIAAQIEKDQMLNAREEKRILDAKEKINFFSNKGGKMRKIANKMREEVEEAEDNKVDVRKDDRTIRPFEIPFDNYVGPIVTVNSVSLMDPESQTVSSHVLQFPIEAKKGDRYILSGPNGIGKSTLLKKLINAHDDEAMIHKDVKV